MYFPPDVQAWIDVLLEPLNDMLISHQNALSGKLTFGDNIKSEVKTFAFTNATESPNILHGQSQYFGIIPISSSDKLIYFSDRIVDNDNIAITARFDTAKTGTVKFLILGA